LKNAKNIQKFRNGQQNPLHTVSNYLLMKFTTAYLYHISTQY